MKENETREERQTLRRQPSMLNLIAERKKSASERTRNPRGLLVDIAWKSNVMLSEPRQLSVLSDVEKICSEEKSPIVGPGLHSGTDTFKSLPISLTENLKIPPTLQNTSRSMTKLHPLPSSPMSASTSRTFLIDLTGLPLSRMTQNVMDGRSGNVVYPEEKRYSIDTEGSSLSAGVGGISSAFNAGNDGPFTSADREIVRSHSRDERNRKVKAEPPADGLVHLSNLDGLRQTKSRRSSLKNRLELGSSRFASWRGKGIEIETQDHYHRDADQKDGLSWVVKDGAHDKPTRHSQAWTRQMECRPSPTEAELASDGKTSWPDHVESNCIRRWGSVPSFSTSLYAPTTISSDLSTHSDVQSCSAGLGDWGASSAVKDPSEISLLAPSTIGLGFSPFSSAESLPESLEAEALDLTERTLRPVLVNDAEIPKGEKNKDAEKPQKPMTIPKTPTQRRKRLIARNTFYLPPKQIQVTKPQMLPSPDFSLDTYLPSSKRNSTVGPPSPSPQTPTTHPSSKSVTLHTPGATLSLSTLRTTTSSSARRKLNYLCSTPDAIEDLAPFQVESSSTRVEKAEQRPLRLYRSFPFLNAAASFRHLFASSKKESVEFCPISLDMAFDKCDSVAPYTTQDKDNDRRQRELLLQRVVGLSLGANGIGLGKGSGDFDRIDQIGRRAEINREPRTRHALAIPGTLSQPVQLRGLHGGKDNPIDLHSDISCASVLTHCHAVKRSQQSSRPMPGETHVLQQLLERDIILNPSAMVHRANSGAPTQVLDILTAQTTSAEARVGLRYPDKVMAWRQDMLNGPNRDLEKLEAKILGHVEREKDMLKQISGSVSGDRCT